MVLTLVMCFLCKAAGAAVLQPGSLRFRSLRFSMSLGKAACLQSLNLLKTSSCICRPILHISVYCCRIFIWEIGDLTSLGLILKSTGDWQTNKQTDRPKDNKACGQTSWWLDSEPEAHIWSLCPPSLSRKTLWTLEKLTHCGRTDWTVVAASVFKQNQRSSCYLWSICLKYDTADTYYDPCLHCPLHIRGV